MKAKFISLFAFLFSITIFIGCKKSANPDINFGFHKVKVYDDTEANIEYGPIRITAGAGRLYMTYRTSSLSDQNSAGTPVTKTKVMATDNEGNLIWRIALPDGMVMGDLLVLDDGSCLVIPRFGKFNNILHLYTAYFFRFNQYGQQISLDSLTFPSALYSFGFNSINVCRSLNGNLLLYGTYNGSVFPGNIGASGTFAGEYSVNGNSFWTKDYARKSLSRFTGCLPTPDGGYLFVGEKNYQAALFKTNASGDSLWTRYYNQTSAVCQNIITADNGNFRFSFSATEPNNYAHKLMHIYEVNVNGDSIKAVTFEDIDGNYPLKIISTNDGGVFVLKNAMPQYSQGITNVTQPVSQFNTSYVSFDPRLNVNSKGLFQTETSDLLPAVCKTSDGNLACFGLIQSYDRSYYKPQLIILK